MDKKKVALMMGGSKKIPWYLSGGIPSAVCEAAYQPIGATSYVSSKVNLVNSSTHALVDTNHIPAWTAEGGWSNDAVANLYLLSDIVPIKNSAYIIRFSDYVAGSTGLCEGANQYYGVGYAFGTTWRFGNGASKDIAMINAYGTLAVSGLRCFIDGVYKGSISDADLTTTQKLKFLISSLNTDATLKHALNGKVQAVAYYTTVLSDDVILGLHTAMMALP